MHETQEMQVQSLGQEDPLKEEMATHSNILTWKTPWTENPWRTAVHGVAESDTTEVTEQKYVSFLGLPLIKLRS